MNYWPGIPSQCVVSRDTGFSPAETLISAEQTHTETDSVFRLVPGRRNTLSRPFTPARSIFCER